MRIKQLVKVEFVMVEVVAFVRLSVAFVRLTPLRFVLIRFHGVVVVEFEMFD